MVTPCPSSRPWFATYYVAAALMLPILGLLGWTLNGISHATPPLGRVYTVTTISDHLLREPARWVGRTVRVRGQYSVACASWSGSDPYAPCVSWETGLVDPGASARPSALPLTSGDSAPILAFIRRLPLLGLLVPQQHMPAWGHIAVYRVRLEAVLCGPAPRCLYQGVLVDAMSGAG